MPPRSRSSQRNRPRNTPGASTIATSGGEAAQTPVAAPPAPVAPAQPNPTPTAGSADASSLSRREQRLLQQQRERERLAAGRRRQLLIWSGGGAALVVGIVVLIVALVRLNTHPTLPETYQPASGVNDHVAPGTSIQYKYEPPSSGEHYPSPANWGDYPQGLATGTWVHNLEHGGIVVLYRCPSDCSALQQQLAALYNQIPVESKFQERKLVITPYPTLDQPVRVQAWGWTMPLQSVDTSLIDAFYNEHVDKGPEQIP
jgi:hypothetical protein